ncbi:MAG: GTP-binding protein [Promethearchaeati archaeon SRVP18_Atabeyarchaeia-1]
MFQSPKFVFKVVVVGEGGVGKTSLILRYTQDRFLGEYITTIGTNFAVKTLNIDGQQIKLQMWDLGGQAQFMRIRSFYYPGARAAVLVYSIADRNTFEVIPKWAKEVKGICGDIPLTLLGNKTDLDSQRSVKKEDGATQATQINAEFFETSAKTGELINSAFTSIAKRIFGKMNP